MILVSVIYVLAIKKLINLSSESTSLKDKIQKTWEYVEKELINNENLI